MKTKWLCLVATLVAEIATAQFLPDITGPYVSGRWLSCEIDTEEFYLKVMIRDENHETSHVEPIYFLHYGPTKESAEYKIVDDVQSTSLINFIGQNQVTNIQDYPLTGLHIEIAEQKTEVQFYNDGRGRYEYDAIGKVTVQKDNGGDWIDYETTCHINTQI